MALALAAGLVLLASAPAANAGTTNYCYKNRVQNETCWARDAAGNLDNHTYNDNWLLVQQGHGFLGCARIKIKDQPAYWEDCDYSNNAYISIGNNTTVMAYVYIFHAENRTLQLNGSAAF